MTRAEAREHALWCAMTAAAVVCLAGYANAREGLYIWGGVVWLLLGAVQVLEWERRTVDAR